MVLRFIAFRLTSPGDYKGQDFDLFLREAMKWLNVADDAAIAALEDGFNAAMQAAAEIFGDYAFRKRNPSSRTRRLPINKALFEAVTVNLAILSAADRGRLAERRKLVDDKFVKLMTNAEFQLAISQGTGDPGKVRYRFGAVRATLEEVLG